jgi:hypothetical protein
VAAAPRVLPIQTRIDPAALGLDLVVMAVVAAGALWAYERSVRRSAAGLVGDSGGIR